MPTYKVYRDGAEIASDITEKVYQDTGLTPNTTYEYQVSIVSDLGEESALSEAISVTTDYSAVTSVTLDQSTLALETGSTGQLAATVEPATADQSVTWTSDNESVATVDQSGLVTAVAEGSANITATSDADGTMSDTCAVTVSNPVPDAPTGLESTSNTDTTVDLSWN